MVEMAKSVLMVCNFCGDFDGLSNNRFNYLAELLSEHGANVELLTSDFSHVKKSKRPPIDKVFPYKVTFVSEPPYIKNISLKRFYSHFMLGLRMARYLKNLKKPDAIYCAVPSLDVAFVAGQYAKKHNIRFIVDVNDLWPEAFSMVFNIPLISNLIFLPMRHKARYIYGVADEIVAVSETYARIASQAKNNNVTGISVFLGTDLDRFDDLAKSYVYEENPADEFKIAYVGTLGRSYDLRCVMDALKILKDQGVRNLKFIVMGDGPRRVEFEKYAENLGIDVQFLGLMDYGKMVGLLVACDIAVNPIVKGAPQSIINKHADYAAAGLPVINSQECPEYRNLIDWWGCGLNCDNNNPLDMAQKISVLLSDSALRAKYGQNSRSMAEQKFNRKNTYGKIVELILGQ